MCPPDRGRGGGETLLSRATSCHRLQSLLSDECEQLKRCAPRVLLTALPLADEAGGDVEITCENRLARFFALPDLPDLPGGQILDRRQAHFVERLHRPLFHDARLAQTERGLVHGCQRVTAIFLPHGR